MANFFKEYHTERRATRNIQPTRKEYNRGDIININPMYDENRNGKRYFVEYLGDNSILLAKNKKDAMNGYGYIYSTCDIIKEN
jgi:hypothetical protein